MPIPKGTTPNPGGQFADKPFRESLRRALLREGKDKAIALDKIAQALIDAALEGNVQAMKEIADRTDGKAMQAMEHSGPGGTPLGVIVVPAKSE